MHVVSDKNKIYVSVVKNVIAINTTFKHWLRWYQSCHDRGIESLKGLTVQVLYKGCHGLMKISKHRLLVICNYKLWVQIILSPFSCRRSWFLLLHCRLRDNNFTPSRFGPDDTRQSVVVWYGRPHAWHRGQRNAVSEAGAQHPDEIHAGITDFSGLPDWYTKANEDK